LRLRSADGAFCDEPLDSVKLPKNCGSFYPILAGLSWSFFAKEFRESHKGRWVPVDRLGGFCLLLKREVLTKIGVELEPWTDLSLFDTDILSSKARQAGFTLACCRDCFVHHFGTRTLHMARWPLTKTPLEFNLPQPMQA